MQHNPSSKCPVTFPLKLEDFPSHPFYPGKNDIAVYNEDVFVAYRHFVTVNKPVLAAFGFGLSYTTFDIGKPQLGKLDLSKSKKSIKQTLTVQVTNSGNRDGAEVVQCYIESTKSSVPRPRLELAAFAKIELAAGASGEVSLKLERDAFSYWDDNRDVNGLIGAWVVEAGKYLVHVGNSSVDLPHVVEVELAKGFLWRGA